MRALAAPQEPGPRGQELSAEQHEALAYVAQAEGRNWKRALAIWWMNGGRSLGRDEAMTATLQRLRTLPGFGSRGLVGYKVQKPAGGS